jgi:hypothetical protein
MQVFLILLIVLCGCARGGSVAGDGEDGGISVPRPDAAVADARPAPRPDAAPPPPDAPPPAPAPAPDACVPVTTQLLVNAALDLGPQGTGWIEQVIKSGYPLITAQDNTKTGPTEHTEPYKVWLGGFTGNQVTDVLYQDVAIPPLTSQLVLAGFFAVRTDEPAGGAYDTASVELTQPGGAVIATVLAVSNATPQAAWAPFQHTFTQNLSGQTVRLRASSTNDGARVTSFYFDTLALTAIHGCP